jgi:ankyrin repeat protein
MKNDFIYFKGPSKEKILKATEDLSLDDKFRLAVLNNILWLVKECIKKGIDPGEFIPYYWKETMERQNLNNWAIWAASELNHIEIVKLLLKDKRVDPSENENKALIWAQRNKNKNMIKLLLKDQRVINELSFTDKENFEFMGYIK